MFNMHSCSNLEWESWAELWIKQWSDERLKISQIVDEPWGSCPRCWPEQWHSAGQPHMNRGQLFEAAIVIHFTCTSQIHLFPLISHHEFSTHTLTPLPSGLLCSAALNRSAHSWAFLAWRDVDFKNLFDVACFLSPPSQRVSERGERVRHGFEKTHLIFVQ